MLRIACDLDDTIFGFEKAFDKYFKCNITTMKSSDITNLVNTLRLNKHFWSNLDLLERPDFDPCIYATKRINSKKYTRSCLIKHNLPVKPIYQIYKQEDNKARIIKGRCDVLIDDSWFNVQQCLSVGMPALLITRPNNINIKTKFRVNHLSYKEIEAKYNELFK